MNIGNILNIVKWFEPRGISYCIMYQLKVDVDKLNAVKVVLN